MKKETFVYALDLSLSSTGIAIFTNDGKLVEVNTVDTTHVKETKLKLKFIGQEIIKYVKAYPPSIVILEQGFTRFNVSTQQVFRVHGIVNYILSDYEQLTVPATTIKKEVGGKGNMKKDEIQDIVSKVFPKVRFNNYDESDAVAIGLYYFYKNNILKREIS